ncbi:MAG: PAS domain-containing protein [Alphaproteobacteria bacterium]|nr:PAS domain-containing protein [Alphaproteobacteria bacterium]
MPDRAKVALRIGGVGALAVVVVAGTALLARDMDRDSALMLALAGAGLIAAALALLWQRLSVLLFDPLAALSAELATIAEQRHGERAIHLADGHGLGPVLPHLHRLLDRLRADRHQAEAAQVRTKAQLTERQSWLDAILADLSDGILVVAADHRVIQANPAAARLLGEEIAPGQPLFALVTREPVLHVLAQLSTPGYPSAKSAAMVCATTDASRLLHGRLTVIAGFGGYLVRLSDSGRDDAALERDNALRKAITQDLRRPIANLRAAAETISTFPDMTARERAAFDEVVVEESTILSQRIEELESDFLARSDAQGVMADIYSLDLFNCLARDCARDRVGLTMEGIPLWLKGDAQSLPLVLHSLILRLRHETGCTGFDVEALLADRHVYLDISWNGPAIASSSLDSWLNRTPDGSSDRRSLRDILDQHGSEPWSQVLKGKDRAILRLPFPAPERLQFTPSDQRAPSRPEFHDFALMRAHCDAGPLSDTRLSALSFVVFDCETTGLRPDDGDAIIQIGAVRVAGGKVLTADTFDRLVNPGRPIPPSSTIFHGITDAMVKDKPPLSVVRPQFLDFAAGSVLAGHNAAFDLRFLLTGQAPPISIPVVDTMLLSGLADPGADSSLDALARRLGVSVPPHRSALADALTTADVLVRLFERLEARGLVTLGQVLAAAHESCAINSTIGAD